MKTSYPFALPTSVIGQLPAPGVDGLRNIDVLVGGTWDGILVVNADGYCIGIRVRRRVEEYPLPFEPSAIEAVRPASLWNRALAQIPFDLYDASVVTVLLVSPAFLAASYFWLPALACIAVVACLLSVYFMYQVHGFPLIRPLVALLGLCQAAVGSAWFIRWVATLLRGSA